MKLYNTEMCPGKKTPFIQMWYNRKDFVYVGTQRGLIIILEKFS